MTKYSSKTQDTTLPVLITIIADYHKSGALSELTVFKSYGSAGMIEILRILDTPDIVYDSFLLVKLSYEAIGVTVKNFVFGTAPVL
jgi:hypothetical protein